MAKVQEDIEKWIDSAAKNPVNGKVTFEVNVWQFRKLINDVVEQTVRDTCMRWENYIEKRYHGTRKI